MKWLAYLDPKVPESELRAQELLGDTFNFTRFLEDRLSIRVSLEWSPIRPGSPQCPEDQRNLSEFEKGNLRSKQGSHPTRWDLWNLMFYSVSWPERPQRQQRPNEPPNLVGCWLCECCVWMSWWCYAKWHSIHLYDCLSEGICIFPPSSNIALTMELLKTPGRALFINGRTPNKWLSSTDLPPHFIIINCLTITGQLSEQCQHFIKLVKQSYFNNDDATLCLDPFFTVTQIK